MQMKIKIIQMDKMRVCNVWDVIEDVIEDAKKKSCTHTCLMDVILYYAYYPYDITSNALYCVVLNNIVSYDTIYQIHNTVIYM